MSPPDEALGGSPAVRDSLRKAFRRLLNPLVRIMLRSGMVAKDLEEIVRQVFVDVASSEEFAIEGRNQISNTRLAILTGLTRDEVAKLRRGDSFQREFSNMSRVARVLNEWQRNARYTGAYGVPLELPFESERDEPTFTELVRNFSGDMSPRAMLEELVRIDAVTQFDDGTLKLQSSTYLPAPMDEASIEHLGTVIQRVADTLIHNNDERNAATKRVERLVYSDQGFPEAKYADLQKLVRDKSAEFLEVINSWIVANELSNNAADTPAIRAARREIKRVYAGVGIYQFLDQADSGASDENKDQA
jgi:hypothetical protein